MCGVFSLLKGSAIGRKRTLVLPDFGVSERPLLRKADAPEYPQDFHKIDQPGTAACGRESTGGTVQFSDSLNAAS